MIQVFHLRDILREPRAAERTLVPFRAGLRVRDLAPPGFDLDAGHAVIRRAIGSNHRALSGKEVEEDLVEDGDELTFGEVPGIIEAIFGASALATILDFIILAGVAVGISYALAALTAPNTRIRQGEEDGPARSWEGIQDTAGSGRPIPAIYGKIRTGGQFLQSFERQRTGQEVEDGITTLHTLLGVCVGPIKSISDVEINGNKVSTIPDVTIETRLGTARQKPIPGFNDLVSEIVHQRPVLKTDGWLTFVTTRAVDAIEITLRFPGGLFVVPKHGGFREHDVTFEYELYQFQSGFKTVERTGRKVVSGKTRNPYKAQVKEEDLPLAFYEIRIRRTTLDDADQNTPLNFQSQSEVYAISEITYEPMAHPGIALVGIKQLPSVQVSGQVPTNYTFLVEGFDDIRIYSDTSNYTVGWSDNPAWCCAHFLTSALHGLGDKYDWTSIDLPAFLAWAQSCDRLVDNGKGALEKRARFNHVFNTIEPADDQIQVFGQGSGAFVFKRGSKWTVVLDEPNSMIWVANEGNIEPGTFRYTWLPARSLANRITVAFMNEEENYRRDTYTEELPDLAPGTPYVDADRSLWGVTNPRQAARVVRRLLLHNKLDRAQVELEAPIDSLRMHAGAVFGVAVRQAAIGVANGRILQIAPGNTAVRIDDEVTLEAGKSYEIVVHHGTGDLISTKAVVNSPGTTEWIYVADDKWQATLAEGDTYCLGQVNSAIEKFRCIETSLDSKWRRKIRGLKYDPAVYTDDLAALPTLIESGIPDPRLLPPDPTELQLFEKIQARVDGTLENVIEAHWTAPVSSILDYFEVWSKASDALNYSLSGVTKNAHFTIQGVETGTTYDVAIVSVSSNGMRRLPKDAPKATVAVTGITAQPSDLSNLRASIIDGTLVATVDPVPEGELGSTGYYEWRRGSSWNQSVLLDKTRTPRLELKSYARGSTSILVKAVNALGNKSANAASVSLTLYGQIEENIIVSQEEFPSWPGSRSGFVIEGGTNKLSLLQPQASVTILPPRGRTRRTPRRIGFGFPPLAPVAVPEGLYTMSVMTISAGNLVRARPDVQVVHEAIYIGLGSFQDATFSFENAKAQIPFSGEEADKITVTVESRWSTTDQAETSFTPWAEHRDRAEVDAKYIQFRLRVKTSSAAYSAKVSSFKVSIDLPDKVTSGSHTQGSAQSFTITYPSGFFVVVKRLLVTLIGGANGDYVKITAQSQTSFTAEIRDSAHNLTTGTIHYEARGY